MEKFSLFMCFTVMTRWKKFDLILQAIPSNTSIPELSQHPHSGWLNQGHSNFEAAWQRKPEALSITLFSFLLFKLMTNSIKS